MTKQGKPLPGLSGERAAARYLENLGYEILEYNYHVSGSEVDLIASKGDELCFVEVKTRGSDEYGLPEEFVDRRKRHKIIRAAKIYSATDRYIDFYIRFDIISILYKPDDIIINHIEHAFEG